MLNSMNKLISIYISFDGLSDPLGQSQIIPYLEKIKLKNNFKIFTMEKKNIQKSYFKKKKIICHNLKFIYSRNVVVKALNYINFFFLILKKTSGYKINIIHCRGFLPAIFGLIISYFKKSKIIYDMRGFWIDEKIDNGVFEKNTFSGKIVFFFLKKVEKYIIKSSSVIVVLSYNAKKYISKNFNRKNKIFVIPCSVDYKKFDHLRYPGKKNLKKQLGLNPSCKTMIYVGSYGNYYMVEEMLQLFKLIKGKLNINFLIVTNQKLKFRKFFKKFKEIKIINTKWENVPRYLSIADVSFCLIKPTFAKIASTPTKASESFSMGVPIITNKQIGDYEKIIKTDKIGCLIDLKNIKNINNYLKIISLFKLNKNVVRSKSQKYFDINVAVKKYNKIYELLS